MNLWGKQESIMPISLCWNMFHFASTDSFFITSKSFANSCSSFLIRVVICSLLYVKLAFDWFFLSRCKVHLKNTISWSLTPGIILASFIILLFVSTRSIILSCLVGSWTSWVRPRSSMISSSPSEFKDQFVVGWRPFHLRSGALKSPATITLFVFNLLLIWI